MLSFTSYTQFLTHMEGETISASPVTVCKSSFLCIAANTWLCHVCIFCH